jgi:PAS domain S-box-containing protein
MGEQEQVLDPALEAKRLQRCINDLVGVLSLPAIWRGSEPSQIIETLLDALSRMLNLEFAYARLNNSSDTIPVEVLRIAEHGKLSLSPDELRNILSSLFASNARSLPRVRSRLGVEETSIFPVPLGIHGEIGMLVVGSNRVSFPEKTESLLLSVAANQASIGLQDARFRNQQQRIAEELDRRVAERTTELAAANAALQLQVGLLQRLPVSAWTLQPDGTPDFVNQVWLDFAGQTPDFVRSHPEAWMTAVHPEDREMAAKKFWEGVNSGQDFAFETRSLRAQDRTYRWHLQQAVVLRDAEGKVLKFVGTTTDIDDQKRAEEALRARELILRRIIDAIPTLSWCFLPDGPSEFLNKGWHEYTGFSPKQSHGWGWTNAIHPDDLPALMKKRQELLGAGEPGEMEARLRRHDGVYRWFLIRIAPFHNEAGKIDRWYGTSTDIEDRKRAEEALGASERNLRLIINTMPVLAWSAQADGNVDFQNQRWLDYTGLSPEQAQGWGWAQAFHPDDIGRLNEYWLSTIATGQPGEIETRMRRFDRTYRWFLFRMNPLRDDSGTIVKWYGTNTDIDDRKRAEEQLRRSEASLAQAQYLSRTGSFSWRVTNDEIAWSEQLYRIFDFEPGTPVTIERINSRVHPDDLAAMIERVAVARVSGGPFEYEHRLLMPDGSVKYLMAIARRTSNGAANLEYMGAVQDITQRRFSEEALARARSELAKVARITSLGILTASIAHEVNQPLSGIITNSGTCMRMLSADPPNVEGARETVRRTIRDGNRASDVISRLRTLYSKKEPVLELMDLNEAAREVTALSWPDIQRSGVILRQEFAEDLPPALGDRIQLQQVILNLLRNAADAMSTVDDHPRYLLIRTELDDSKQIRLSVKDSGVGFSPQDADKMFAAFHTTKSDGMGIGLSISRSIIEAHQGRLWAMQNDGPGSTFSFSIPCSSESQRGSGIGVDGPAPSTTAA